MSLVVPWLVLPLVLGVLSAGCGLLLKQAAGTRVPRALLVPLGFAVVVVVGVLTTATGTTARLTIPLVIGLAVAGIGLSLPWHTRAIDWWAAAAAAGAFLAYGAPVIMSGHATFAGYITLDDTATWLGMTDRLLTHGRTLTGLEPSSYQAALNWYWNDNGYPTGAFPPLGIVHALLGTDSAWLVQAYIAFSAGLLALALYGLAGRLIEPKPFRALAAVVAAQPALLYAYALWGGVKEVPAAVLVVLVAALVPTALREDARARSLLPLAVASAALVALLNFSSAVWIAPLLVPGLVAGIRLRGRRFAALAAAFAAVVIVLCVPALISAAGFLNNTSTLLTKETELGNLIGPVSKLQLFGVWPVGDFRLEPDRIGPTYLLVAVVAAAATAGLVWAYRRRIWEVPLYVGGTVAGCVLAVAVGSPWIDAKALAIASPAVLIAGMAGAAWLLAGRRTVEALVVAGLIAGGVLWSNALAYHDVWLAPRDQLRELEEIGDRFGGDGPALMTEYQPYGVRHFLRDLDPEAPSELRRRVVPLRDGSELAKGRYADIDEFGLEGILVYRTLVLPRSPAASRPPSPFRLVWSGDYYSVWQQEPGSAKQILEHLSLGSGDQPAAVPVCRDVRRLADLAAGQGGTLAAAVRRPNVVAQLSQASYPFGWQAFSGNPDAVFPYGSGVLHTSVDVPRAGRYPIWLGGSFRGSLEASIDGSRLFQGRHQLIHEGLATPLGVRALDRGRHELELRYDSARLSPGSGGRPFPLGPLLLGSPPDEVQVQEIPPEAAESLCGSSLDWIEALGS